jgi:hypothetical protein
MPAGNTITVQLNQLAVDVSITSPAQGQLFYRDSAKWQNLAVGTSGQFLQTKGAGQNPVWASVTVPTSANPSAVVGTSAVNGSASTFMTSDSAPALSVAITPTWTGVHTWSPTMSANTSTDGQVLATAGTASSGNQYYSPRTRWRGQGWKTTATAASQPVDFIAEVQPVQGTTNPSGNWVLSSQVNGGGYSQALSLDNSGDLTIAGVMGITGTGTKYVPALTFSGDTTAGWWRPAQNQWAWTSSGTTCIQILTAQIKVGANLAFNWAAGADAPSNGVDTGLIRNSAANVGFTNGSSTTYAIIGSKGLFLAEMSAPSTPTGGGSIYVDSSGNLYYLSPGGTSTKLASD